MHTAPRRLFGTLPPASWRYRSRWLLLWVLVIGAVCADDLPLRGAPPAPMTPLQIQLNHPLVGALGQPFMVTVSVYSSRGEEVTYEGDVVDGTGAVALTGKWDLVLEEIQAERVIASRSLKPSPASTLPPATHTVRPYSNENTRWTWDAQTAVAHVGNYRLRLRYGEQSFDGDQFRIDTTLDPPPWIVVSVTPDRIQAVVGEPVMVTLEVRNQGMDGYPAVFGGDYRGASRALRFFCTARRSDGVRGWDPEPGQSCFGGVMQAPLLKPGGTRQHRFVLGAYVRCPGPGSYLIRVYHALGFGTPMPGIDGGASGFRPCAKAGEFTLELTPPGPEDGKRIVRQALNVRDDYERAHRLLHLHEPYFLAALQEALAQPENAAHGLELVDGIASINTIAATAVLIDALDDRTPTIRRRASERLRFRMPRADWLMDFPHSAAQVKRRRQEEEIVALTWDEAQAGHLWSKLGALIESGDADVQRGAIDLLGMVGAAGAAESIALIADRLGTTAEALTQNAQTMNHIENAAYTLGLRKLVPCAIETKSTPGRLICWARTLEGARPSPTVQSDAVLMDMVGHRSAAVRRAALRGMDKGAGVRLPLPWKVLFLDSDQTVFHLACDLSAQAPPAVIAGIVHECLGLDLSSDRRAYFKMMLEHVEPAK